MLKFIIVFQLLQFASNCYGQNISDFKKVSGIITNYSFEISKDFNLQKAIGTNIDLKLIDDKGNSVISTVVKIPQEYNNSESTYLNTVTVSDFVQDMQAIGLLNVKVINRGLITINNEKCVYVYYTSDANDSFGNVSKIYYHSIYRFKNGYFINIQYSCSYNKKDILMPYINRMVQSIRY